MFAIRNPFSKYRIAFNRLLINHKRCIFCFRKCTGALIVCEKCYKEKFDQSIKYDKRTKNALKQIKGTKIECGENEDCKKSD